MAESGRPRSVSDEEILAAYDPKKSQMQIASEVGLSDSQLSVRLRKLNLHTRAVRGPTVSDEDIIAAYNKNPWSTQKQIGAEVGLKEQIYERFKALGLPTGRKRISDEIINADRESGETQAQIGERYKITRQAVSERERRRGKPRRPGGRRGPRA